MGDFERTDTLHDYVPAPPGTKALLAKPLWHEKTLLAVYDCLLVGILCIAPLFMGGRYATGRFVLVSMICAASVTWMLRQTLAKEHKWVFSRVEWLLLAGLAIVGLQIIPLPENWLGFLSPNLASYLPAWHGTNEEGIAGLFGRWSTVSVDPYVTQGGMSIYIAYLLLFVTVIQRVRTLADVERIIIMIAAAGVFMAAFGLVHFLSANGRFFWLYEHPFRTTFGNVKGCFINENHYAHFLVLCLPALLYCVFVLPAKKEKSKTRQTDFGGKRSKNNRLYLLALPALVLLCALLSMSRGAVMLALFAMVLTTAFFAIRRLLTYQTVLALGTAAALVVIALAIHGQERLQRELGTIVESNSASEIDGVRVELWKAMGPAVSDFNRLGTGVGTFREIYPTFYKQHTQVEYTHAENGYLQVLIETGIPGLLLLVTAISIMGYWSVVTLLRSNIPTDTKRGQRPEKEGKSRRASQRLYAMGVAVAVALCVSLLHSIWDFVWYIPACMSLTVMLAACGFALYRLRHPRPEQFERPVSRAISGAALVCTLFVGLAIVSERFYPAMAAPGWSDYQRMTIQTQTRSEFLSYEDRLHENTQMYKSLGAALDWTPDDPEMNLMMTTVLRDRFNLFQEKSDNDMTVIDFREAVFRTGFQSQTQMDQWLERVTGEHYPLLGKALNCAQRSVTGAPFRGAGYMDFAEFGFLRGCGHPEQLQLQQQAARVRPYDGEVFFITGRDLVFQGKPDEAIANYRKAYRSHCKTRLKRRLTEQVASLCTPEQFIQTFEPDEAGLWMLLNFYRQKKLTPFAHTTGLHLIQTIKRRLEQPGTPPDPKDIISISSIYHKINQPEQALYYYEQAIGHFSADFKARRHYAFLLKQNGRYDDALEELYWCLDRSPSDPFSLKLKEGALHGKATHHRTANQDQPRH